MLQKEKVFTQLLVLDERRILRAIFGLPEAPTILVTEIRDGCEVIACSDCDRQQLAAGHSADRLVDLGWRSQEGVWRCPFCTQLTDPVAHNRPLGQTP